MIEICNRKKIIQACIHLFKKNTYITHFFGNKTVEQRFGAILKMHVFWKILMQISCFFLAVCLAQKTLKMTISASVWSAQHPNAGQNIQQISSYTT